MLAALGHMILMLGGKLKDPYWANVAVLLKFNDSANKARDESGRVWTIPYPASVLLSTDAPKLEESTGYFFYASQSMIRTVDTSNLIFGTGDFTIEFFAKWTTAGVGNDIIFSFRPYNVAGAPYPIMYLTAANILNFLGGVALASDAAIPYDGVLRHFAVVRKSGVTSLYVAGQRQGSGLADNTSYNCGQIVIGGDGYYGDDSSLEAYLDDFRITTGVARYTGNFTPPTDAFPIS